MTITQRAPRNRTLSCDQAELEHFAVQVGRIHAAVEIDRLAGQVLAGDMLELIRYFPAQCVDLLILDPPYNLSKNYHGHLFKEQDKQAYQRWFQQVIEKLLPVLKPSATVYVCADWKTSVLIAPLLETYFHVRNRITWEREKGRGAKSNWKNNTEDIWFCTVSNAYYFDVEAVKLKRKVIAPYRLHGKPKDWAEEPQGKYRLTHPSNIWSDITVPFWSMPENTDHPTQKPEKLLAKLILASSKTNDFVFDPFMGSGTSLVVAKKLKRQFCGIERNPEYCCWALKRLAMADEDDTIQGYIDGVFWERNSLSEQISRHSQTLQPTEP